MRGRGQMCRLVWVSVAIIESEGSVRGGKIRHVHRKLMENPHREWNLVETKC